MPEANDLLCWRCISDPILSAWVRQRGNASICSFCLRRFRACELQFVAEEVDRVMRQFYRPAGDTPHVVDWSDNIQYWQDGETAVDILGEIAGIEPEVAQALVDVLAESEWRDVADGDDSYYGDSPLQQIRAYPHGFMEIWLAFEERLKHQKRFFDEVGKGMLDELFGDLPSIAGGEAILTIAPGDELATLFRVRIVDDESVAEEFVRDPARHIGPPPPHLARAGRMNPAGIPAFYGAFSSDIALAEIRPPVGSMVAVGKFSLLRPVKLLDMAFLPFAYHQESIFSPQYDRLRNKVKFLAKFHQRISRPVLPSDEALAYLPTQAVAAYVTHVMDLDGIVYSSTQVVADHTAGGEQVARKFCNIALFGSAAIVERLDVPPRPPERAAAFDDLPLIDIGSTPPAASPGAENAIATATEPQAEASVDIEDAGATIDLHVARDAESTGPPEPRASEIESVGVLPATLKVERDPKLIRITGIKVDTVGMFAHLYPDGSVIVHDYDHDGDDDE